MRSHMQTIWKQHTLYQKGAGRHGGRKWDILRLGAHLVHVLACLYLYATSQLTRACVRRDVLHRVVASTAAGMAAAATANVHAAHSARGRSLIVARFKTHGHRPRRDEVIVRTKRLVGREVSAVISPSSISGGGRGGREGWLLADARALHLVRDRLVVHAHVVDLALHVHVHREDVGRHIGQQTHHQ